MNHPSSIDFHAPLDTGSRMLMAARIGLTLCAFEFFGPCIRDYNASHVYNPDWVGHARLHLVWALGLMLCSGLVTCWLIWRPRPLRLIHLAVAVAWLGSNLAGFWGAVLLAPTYGGELVMPGLHIKILGIEENLFVFSILSGIYLASITMLWLAVSAGQGARTAAVIAANARG